MMKLYDYAPSQNGYKVHMLLRLLGVGYETVPVAIFRAESRTAEFLRKNPAGAVPVLELASGHCIAESNAILWYLAQGTPYWPNDRSAQGKVMQWLFFEQYYVEPNIGTLRFWTLTNRLAANQPMVAAKRAGGERALDGLDRVLLDQSFLVDESFTIADIACFAYVHLAQEGGFDLASRHGIRAWIERVRCRPEGVPEVHPYDTDAFRSPDT